MYIERERGAEISTYWPSRSMYIVGAEVKFSKDNLKMASRGRNM